MTTLIYIVGSGLAVGLGCVSILGFVAGLFIRQDRHKAGGDLFAAFTFAIAAMLMAAFTRWLAR